MASFVILCNLSPVGVDAVVRDGVSPADQIADAIGRIDPTPELSIWWTKGPYALIAVVENVQESELHAALIALAGRGTIQTTTLPAVATSGIADIITRARAIDGHIRGGHIRGGNIGGGQGQDLHIRGGEVGGGMTPG
jgi:uncharacterized protein with GYD domain